MLSIFFSNIQLVVFVAHLLEMFFKFRKASFSIIQEDLLFIPHLLVNHACEMIFICFNTENYII